MILSISCISETGSDSDTDVNNNSSNNIADNMTRGEEGLEKTKVKMYKMDVKYLLFRPSGNSWMKELLPNYSAQGSLRQSDCGLKAATLGQDDDWSILVRMMVDGDGRYEV